MKDICPFCELPEPIHDKMVFEAGKERFTTECQKCPHCNRRYYTTSQVRKLVELVADVAAKGNAKTNARTRTQRKPLLCRS